MVGMDGKRARESMLAARVDMCVQIEKYLFLFFFTHTSSSSSHASSTNFPDSLLPSISSVSPGRSSQLHLVSAHS